MTIVSPGAYLSIAAYTEYPKRKFASTMSTAANTLLFFVYRLKFIAIMWLNPWHP